jgi:hypothetical protein
MACNQVVAFKCSVGIRHHGYWIDAYRVAKQPRPGVAAVRDLRPQDHFIEREPHRESPPQVCRLRENDRDDLQRHVTQAGRPADILLNLCAGSYRSFDLTEPRADYAIDLNRPLSRDIGRYDVVTNLGTTEHVFNIGQSFANIHNLLKVGGIQLHGVPSCGYIGHGFYNVHLSAYLDMAKANNYEFVDVIYIDNINVRMARPIEVTPFDWGTLPIQLRDMIDPTALMTKSSIS